MSISEDGKVSLSIKKAIPPAPRSNTPAPRASRPGNYEWQASRKNDASNFEDMMSRFKQTSDEKMSDLKKCMESKRGGFSKHGSVNQPK
jgi:S1 RNA binding domain protein